MRKRDYDFKSSRCPHCAKVKRNKSHDYSKNKKRGHSNIPEWVLGLMPYEQERLEVQSDGYDSGKKYHFICSEGHITERVMGNVVKLSTGEPKEGCQSCRKRNQWRSKGEIEVEKFCENLGYSLGPRHGVLSNQRELDIYLPDIHKAIEYDGEVFHQEGEWSYDEYTIERRKLRMQGRTREEMMLPKWKGYHKSKDDDCLAQGITLLHITDTEWTNNRQETEQRIREFLEV